MNGLNLMTLQWSSAQEGTFRNWILPFWRGKPTASWKIYMSCLRNLMKLNKLVNLYSMFWKHELTASSLIFMSVYSCLFICTDNEKLASINENYELFMTEMYLHSFQDDTWYNSHVFYILLLKQAQVGKCATVRCADLFFIWWTAAFASTRKSVWRQGYTMAVILATCIWTRIGTFKWIFHVWHGW